MQNSDQFHRFVFEQHDIRGELVRLKQSYQDVFHGRNYPKTIRDLLADCLTASVLLSGTLKFDGLLSIQAKGQGPVTLLMAECTHDRRVRAIAKYDGEGESSDLQRILGNGQMAITIEPEKGQRYQGIVPLEKPDIAGCLEYYFRQSEQLETVLFLFNNGEASAGLLLQKLPGHDERGDTDTWNTLCHLAASLSVEEVMSLGAEQILHRLFHEEDVRLFPAEQVRFECSCTFERSANAVKSLGMEDAYQLVAERGAITINCQFCNEEYRLDKPALDELFGSPSVH